MNARNLKIKLKVDSAAEFTRLVESEVLPLLRKQKGFQDEITFVAANRNEAVAISFWDNQDDLDAYNHIAYLDVLRILSKVVEVLPVVETFEVANSTAHDIAAGGPG